MNVYISEKEPIPILTKFDIDSLEDSGEKTDQVSVK